YRLPHVLRDRPDLAKAERVTLIQSLSNIRLSLWDETGQRLISFRQLRDSANPPIGTPSR
ncbi:MAG TPA: hypothetical protein VN685_09620, partial [Rhizomicrobium sp.]|nr:hypothetical protein [Rhizomicrobium sp.]